MVNDGIINRFEQNTGVGKTMNAVYIVNRFFEQTTNNYYDELNDIYYSLGLVFSTCRMFFNENLNPYFRKNDFYYTPLGLLPLWKFDEFNQTYKLHIPVCVIYDDFDNNRMFMERFLKISTSWKRKYHLELNFIGHYDKDVNRKIRQICNNRYILNIYKGNIEGILYRKEKIIDELGIERQIEMPIKFVIKNVFDDLKELYDTNEVVNPSTPITFEQEIIKNCKGMNKKQLSEVLFCFIGNQEKLRKEIERYAELLNIIK